MKSLSSGLQSDIDEGLLPSGWSVKFTRRDADISPETGIFRYVSGTRDATLSGAVYEAQPGFNVSSITCTLGFGIDTLEMVVLTTDDMTRAQFLAGRWDACRVEFNQYNWKTPADGFIPWPAYTVSNVEPIQGGFKLELRDLRQYLQQDMTLITGKTCPHRLGDASCTRVLTTFTHTGTVTSVASRQQFTASGLAQATDYFTAGFVTFDTGLYAGMPQLIGAHTTGGVITLAIPLWTDLAPTDTFTIVAGCLKRFEEDCKTKYANILNFGGQKDAPTVAESVGAA
jgi:uncharacterized phage protein (TIGR02218 family)